MLNSGGIAALGVTSRFDIDIFSVGDSLPLLDFLSRPVVEQHLWAEPPGRIDASWLKLVLGRDPAGQRCSACMSKD